MGRYCYCSKIQPGKTQAVIDHWAKKPTTPSEQVAEKQFWAPLKMTGFESWLQRTTAGDFMIHCLEGESFDGIFKGLREQIGAKNPIALKLQAFYIDVLGKDYSQPDAQPDIECVFDVSLNFSGSIKKGFIYPLLPHKEEAHRKFRAESMGKERARHEASMQSFHVSRLTTWIQNTPHGKYVVVYSERQTCPSTASERLAQGNNSNEWKEIASELMDHTGLSYEDLSPQVEWLTRD